MSGTATAVLAEDEPELRAELQARLTALWPGLNIRGVAADGIEALALFDRHRPQIMFLDIELPGLSGLEVARHVAGACHVVFITAYDAHAIAAFEQGAIDYILKPYDVARLERAVRRIQERLATPALALDQVLRELAIAARPRDYLRWIKAARGHEVDLILVEDVCFFQAEAKYTGVFTRDQEALIRTPIKELAEQLDPERFWRIHRSTIVNVAAIASVARGIGGGMSVRLRARAERLPVSDGHRELFRYM